MYEMLRDLDRRWIFLMMFLAVALPIVFQTTFPEKPSQMAMNVFDAVEDLPDGSRILLAFDFDPASAGELKPMATSFVRHCSEKKHKMYFLALWPVGPQMIDDSINEVIKKDFPDLEYGTDYVNLGFKSGQEAVIKVIVNDLKELYNTDSKGTAFDRIPMMKNVNNVRDMDLVINVSAGYPGTKEWAQYASTPYPEDITLVAGCTGVQAPLLYPYIPDQLKGLLGAIKGAAEYEAAVQAAYGHGVQEGRYMEGQRRMGPQLVGHLLMIGLIVLGNVIYFVGRRRGDAS
jgi:hypothetical protein